MCWSLLYVLESVLYAGIQDLCWNPPVWQEEAKPLNFDPMTE